MDRVRGFRDILGKEAIKLNYIKNICVKIASKFNINEVFLPIMEYKSLFCRAVGDETDIVSKEMFLLEDGDICLRPEMTASSARAVVNSSCFNARWYYFGENFRKERPQKDRYRQFYQFGIELIGDATEASDFDLLEILFMIFKKLNITFCLKINFIPKNKGVFEKDLKEFLQKNYNQLSSDSQTRYDKKRFLRILDSKNDQNILKNAPSMANYLSEEELIKRKKILDFIEFNSINYQLDRNLVRGLDYYNGMVFEIIDTSIDGAQNSLAGGGRYDGLFESMGYQKTPAVGFAIGVDRLMNRLNIKTEDQLILGIINLLNSNMDYRELLCEFIIQRLPSNLKDGLKKANKYNCSWVIIIGDFLELKNMNTGEQKTFENISNIREFLSNLLE